MDVEKIANLAYLELTDQQKLRFQEQFDHILQYVSQLDKVSMTPTEANEMGAYHVLLPFYELLKIDPSESLREEEKTSEVSKLIFSNDEAVTNAPKTGGLPGELLYEVPSIIER